MNERIHPFIKVVFIGACILFNTTVNNFAQETEFYFKNILLPGGAEANYITGIAQDSPGFMWFSTLSGLYRYDGYSFTNYTHDPGDATSFSATWAETVYVDRQGTLWAGTYGGGLNRFNAETETFTHFRNEPDNLNSLSQDSVTVIMEDHLGHLWVGTMGGLNRMDRETGGFTRYRYDPDDPASLGNDQVRAIYEDSRGTLWIGTNSPYGNERDNPGPGGLNRFNRESGTFERYLHDPNDSNSLISNHVMSLFEDSGGTLWVGTWGNGLHTMDREKGTFTRYPYDPDTPGKLSAPYNPQNPEVMGGVRFIHEDSDGALWIGSYPNGLVRYNPATDEVIRFGQDPDDPASLSSNDIWSMYQSQDGTRWITALPGLNQVFPVEVSFEHYTLTPWSNFIYVLHVDSSGTLRVQSLLATVNFQPLENKDSSYQAVSSVSTFDQFSFLISAFEQSKDGTLLFGTYEGSTVAQYGGLYQIDGQTDEFTPVLIGSTNAGERIGPIVAIYEDNEKSLWLGTRYTGLFQLNRETGEVNHYPHDPDNPASLSHSNITKIYESPSEPGALWIGTEGGGLNYFDKETETFTRYQHDPGNTNSLSGDYITSIYEDKSGRLLIGTQRSGLNWLDKENNDFTHFTTFNSGLPDNYVSCILGDDDGHIWMGTPKGLTRFDPESNLFYTYGERHGVKAQPFVTSCTRDPEGRLIFGGNGFTVFHPDDIAIDITAFPVVLTNFLLAGEPIGPDPDGPLQTPIWKSGEIRLPFDKNSFSFEFAALEYRDPESNQYMYKLEGYDLTWHAANTESRASYSRVPFGEYVFRVKAANSMGVWNEEGATLRVTVLPPWWRTWWAYGFYFFILAAGIFVLDQFQRRRLIAKERERAREREIEKEKAHAKEIEQAYHNLEVAHKNLKSAQDQLIQQEKLASLGQLTAGIAHEIKNPLNFVNNFSEVSLELVEEARDEVRSQKAKVKREKKESPLEGGSERSEQGDDAISAKDEASSLLLEILDDIEANLRKIHEHGSRANGIVQSMLMHSRGGDGKMEPTQLNPIVKEYVNLAFHGMRAGKDAINVDIELHLDENVGNVPLIAEDFSRVILNLTNNAFDAMRDKQGAGHKAQGAGDYEPKLTVRTKSENGQILIEIEDNGPGIPDDIKDKIMQPFFTTKKGTQGTGLGLSITNDIVKAHGGSLNIKTEKENGSVFVISLPSVRITD